MAIYFVKSRAERNLRPWRAGFNGKHLGYFHTKEEADVVERKHKEEKKRLKEEMKETHMPDQIDVEMPHIEMPYSKPIDASVSASSPPQVPIPPLIQGNSMTTHSLSSILKNASDRIQQVSTMKDKVAVLYSISSVKGVKDILGLVFDPRVEFALPPGPPPYKPSGQVDSEGVLYKFISGNKFQYFLKGFNPSLSQIKREEMLVGLLESCDPQDAVLVCHVKDKKLPWNGITEELVRLAYPRMTQDWPWK